MELRDFEPYRHFVDLPQGRISYLDTGVVEGPSGTEPPVALFIHGIGANAFLWRNTMWLLREKYRCIAIDIPLHGQSEASPDQDFSLHGLAAVVEEFCRALNLTAVHLVGNDAGGAISQTFAVNHSERLKSFTLTNCDVHSNLPPESFQGTVDLASQGKLWSVAQILLADPDLMRKHSEVAKGYQFPEKLSDELLMSYLDPIMGTEEKAKILERMLVSLKKEDLMALEPALQHLNVPVLLVWGTRDVFFSMEWAHWLQKTLPDVRDLVEIEDGALFFVDERAAELVPHLDLFWSTVS